MAKKATRASTRQSKAKQPTKQLILADSDGADDCASDADTAPAESPKQPIRKLAAGGIVASRSAALNELKAGRQSRASSRNAAAATASSSALKPSPVKATRKSTRTGVRPAVKDRIRALEQATLSDGDASLIIDPSATLKPKKRSVSARRRG